MNPSGFTTSVWMGISPAKEYPALTQNIQCDVCVIGAGIAGLTTAYQLAKAGKRVIVIEKYRQVSQGETSRSTAQLTFFTDYSYSQLKRFHGDDVQMIMESHRYGMETIEQIAREEDIACDFRRVPVFLFAPREKDVELLDKDQKVLTDIGVNVIRHARIPVAGLPDYPCMEVQNLAQIHVLKYMYGLASAVERQGVDIYCNTRATEIKEHAAGVTIQTENGHTIHCTDLVTATNSPISELVGVHLKQAAFRTYVVGLKVEKGALPYALFWDTLDPYHYVRLVEMPDHDVLIAGGEDHHTGRNEDGGETEERFQHLADWAHQTFPQCGELLYQWSGQVMESVDGIGYNGRHGDNKHIYIITGDTGSGTTNATLGAKIVTDQIMGRENPWEKLYHPSRVTLRAADQLIKEGSLAFWQFKDYVTPGDSDGATDISVGSGTVIREGLRKVAIYKDEAGQVHRLSPVCTHVGCIVHWNEIEKSWDCPCHGSRFDGYGKVLNGPALRDLEKIAEPEAVEK